MCCATCWKSFGIVHLRKAHECAQCSLIVCGKCYRKSICCQVKDWQDQVVTSTPIEQVAEEEEEGAEEVVDDEATTSPTSPPVHRVRPHELLSQLLLNQQAAQETVRAVGALLEAQRGHSAMDQDMMIVFHEEEDDVDQETMIVFHEEEDDVDLENHQFVAFCLGTFYMMWFVCTRVQHELSISSWAAAKLDTTTMVWETIMSMITMCIGAMLVAGLVSYVTIWFGKFEDQSLAHDLDFRAIDSAFGTNVSKDEHGNIQDDHGNIIDALGYIIPIPDASPSSIFSFLSENQEPLLHMNQDHIQTSIPVPNPPLELPDQEVHFLECFHHDVSSHFESTFPNPSNPKVIPHDDTLALNDVSHVETAINQEAAQDLLPLGNPITGLQNPLESLDFEISKRGERLPYQISDQMLHEKTFVY